MPTFAGVRDDVRGLAGCVGRTADRCTGTTGILDFRKVFPVTSSLAVMEESLRFAVWVSLFVVAECRLLGTFLILLDCPFFNNENKSGQFVRFHAFIIFVQPSKVFGLTYSTEVSCKLINESFLQL